MLIAALVGMPRGSGAESAPSSESFAGKSAADLFRAGSKQASFLVGYGIGFRTGSTSRRAFVEELGDVGIVHLLPRLGVGLTNPLGAPGSWYRGNIELLFEATLMLNTHPRFGYAGGAGIALRYNFLCGEKVVPYLDFDFQVLGLDFALEGQANGLAFGLGMGVGAHWFVRPRVAIDTEIRLQHISNANVQLPNQGINDVQILLGMSWFFD